MPHVWDSASRQPASVRYLTLSAPCVTIGVQRTSYLCIRPGHSLGPGRYALNGGDTTLEDHRSVALEHACMWAAYAQENGKQVSADEVVAAARQFAAFLSQPTDVHIVDTPTVLPTLKSTRKPAS